MDTLSLNSAFVTAKKFARCSKSFATVSELKIVGSYFCVYFIV